MSYTDEGFDKYFMRKRAKRATPMITRQAANTLIDSLSGDKIVGGIIESTNGQLTIDLENGKMVYNDGIVDLLSLGGSDNNLIIRDTNDSTLVTTG